MLRKVAFEKASSFRTGIRVKENNEANESDTIPFDKPLFS